MSPHRYFIPDFLEIQRESFLNFLKKGILEEFSKLHSLKNQNVELFFYPEYFCLTKPDYSVQQAIFFKKSYISKLYIPVQYTDKKRKRIFLKWVLIAQLPLMTQRGHFLLNGAARVIINQLVRSPGVYFLPHFYEIYPNKWASKPSRVLQRFYADIICLKGTWIRISIDKDFCMWVRLKKGPKIPLLWFLLGMGLNEKMIFQSVISPQFLLKSFLEKQNPKMLQKNQRKATLKYPYVSQTPEAWKEIAKLFQLKKTRKKKMENQSSSRVFFTGDSASFYSCFHKKNRKTFGLFNLSQNISRFSFLSNVPLLNKTSSKKFEEVEIETTLLDQNSSKKLEEQSSNEISKKRTIEEAKKRSKFRDSSNRENPISDRIHPLIDSDLEQYFLLPQKKWSIPQIAKIDYSNLGKKWFYQKFMNPRTYDLGKKGRIAFNQKLGLQLSLNQTTLTGQDLLFITDFLLKVEKGIYPLDDIDHLKNKRIRSAGELIQMQFGIGLMRLEKSIKLKLNKKSQSFLKNERRTFSIFQKNLFKKGDPVFLQSKLVSSNGPIRTSSNKIVLLDRSSVELREQNSFESIEGNHFNKNSQNLIKSSIFLSKYGKNAFNHNIDWRKLDNSLYSRKKWLTHKVRTKEFQHIFLSLSSLVQPKFLNGALKEFFGTHPLSQFMDQINPLSEITHKRRLTSLGPGGVARDTATLAIRGIHPSHYGRICPIETPEGKNTGLVNSLTVYARVTEEGFIQSPFYELYKGQIINSKKFYLSANQEENFQIATPDLNITKKNFLPKEKIPVRFGKNFFNSSSCSISFVGISALQMISVATALIPFLEHDDANRALMGSNMQRQAVPLIRAERPLVGTGLEAKVTSDSGHALTANKSGLILYASGSIILQFSI